MKDPSIRANSEKHREHVGVWAISHRVLETTSEMQSRSCAVAKYKEPSRRGWKLPLRYLPAALGATESSSPNKAMRCHAGINSSNITGLFCSWWCVNGRRCYLKSHAGGSKRLHMSPVFAQNCRPSFLSFKILLSPPRPRQHQVKSCSCFNHGSFATDSYMPGFVSLCFLSTWA